MWIAERGNDRVVGRPSAFGAESERDHNQAPILHDFCFSIGSRIWGIAGEIADVEQVK